MSPPPYVYDAGALIALDRGDPSMRRRHGSALNEGRLVLVPSVVVAQVWRNPQRQHALGRVLASCEIIDVEVTLARSAGVLCGRAASSDAVDALVVAAAVRAAPSVVWTSDPKDLEHLRSVTDDPARLAIATV